MHLDDALAVVGEFGWYQRSRLLLLCGFAVVSAWHALNMVFVGAEPRFRCSGSDVNASDYGLALNLSQAEMENLLAPAELKAGCVRHRPEDILPAIAANGNWSQAPGRGNRSQLQREACPAGYTYFRDEYQSTITTTFNLVCERKFWRSTSKSVFFAGRLTGAVIFGQLSDRFGRRPMFFVGVALLAVAGGVAAAAPSMLIFLPMYFLQGAGHTGAFLVSYTLSTELVGPQYRVVAGFVIQSFYSLGYMSLAGLAYFLRDWRHLEAAITAPALLFVLYWWLLPESIRWQLSHHRAEAAREQLGRVAKDNGRELPPGVLKELQEESGEKGERHYTVLDCLRTWPMAKLSLNVWFSWLVNSMVYYGLALNTENLAGSPYLNFCLAGAVEIPAYALCILLLNRVGRRKPLIFTMYLGGVACIVSGLLPTDSDTGRTLTIVLAMVGKFGITASYGIIYLAAAEVFPTVVRNIGMGVSSMSARIGGIVAPLILDLSAVMPLLPMLIFGGLSVIGATLAFLLPETAGRRLPQSIKDVDSGASCTSSFCWCCWDSQSPAQRDQMDLTVSPASPALPHSPHSPALPHSPASPALPHSPHSPALPHNPPSSASSQVKI